MWQEVFPREASILIGASEVDIRYSCRKLVSITLQASSWLLITSFNLYWRIMFAIDFKVKTIPGWELQLVSQVIITTKPKLSDSFNRQLWHRISLYKVIIIVHPTRKD